MKNHKEIMEALLAGETLTHRQRAYNTAKLVDGFIVVADGGRARWNFSDPADWSILDTTVGLMEALAALSEGKEVQRKGYSDWCMTSASGIVIWCVSGNPVKLDLEWATARFIVRDKP